MTVVRLGTRTMLDIVPLLTQARDLLFSAKALAVAQLQAQLAAYLNITAALTITPPAITATLDAAIALVAQLEASINLTGPTISLQIDAVVGIIAELQLQLELLLAVDIAIPTVTVSLYAYDGQSASFGAEMQSALDADLPGAPGHTNALILATTDAAAWTGVGKVFRVSA